MVRTAIEAGTGLPTALAAVGVVALAGWIGYLLVRRRFDLFDSIVLCTLAIGLCLLVVQRISLDDEAATRLRYGYSVSILLALALVPHIPRVKTTLTQVAVVVIGVVMIAANIDQMKVAINVREEVAQEARLLSIEAARMIDAGEPVVAGPSTLAHGLEINELAHLVDDGYVPGTGVDDATVTENARGALRMNLIDRRRPRGGELPDEGTPPTTDAEIDADGCVELTQDDEITATVTDAGLLTFDKARPQSLQLTWTDEYGVGTRFFDDPDIREGAVELATPDTTAELELRSLVGRLVVCGFAPA